MIDVLKSHAPRKTMAMMLALATALGPTSIPAFGAGKTARDADPATATPNQVSMNGQNIGNLLSAAGMTWGRIHEWV